MLYNPQESNFPLLSVSIGNFHAVETYSLFENVDDEVLILNMVEAVDHSKQIKDYVQEHFYAEYLEGLKGKVGYV